MPRLTEYLLKLATDAPALAEYRKHRDGKAATDLHTYLTRSPSPGLTREQADAILSHDSRRIQGAVRAELIAESSDPKHPLSGVAITFFSEENNIQLERT